MYTVTFYSFKGGVGRTMAMVNVAHDLVARGRRVLIVDFDLEAPGADTFGFAAGVVGRPGIVDYVHEYLVTNRAPAVDPYIHHVKLQSPTSGDLWLMPSGKEDAQYGGRLGEIDWGRLYADRDGFLLFEDLKAQWLTKIHADYVLIDSRTGHTDSGGICTRQLPDAVVVLFFPNAQNLRGLRKVVHDIRHEVDSPRSKAIQTHFVMSNVPELDDEDQILISRIEAFRAELKLDSPPHTIHRYESLALLNQSVFVSERPRSRLAREYRQLTDVIIQSNPEDREGAMQRLSDLRKRRGSRHCDFLKYAEALEDNFHDDGEILYNLAQTHKARGRPDLAINLLSRSIELGYDKAEAYIARAEQTRDPSLTHSDLLSALRSSEITAEDSMRALMLLRAAPTKVLEDVRETSGWKKLPPEERQTLALSWRNSRAELRATVILFAQLLEPPQEEDLQMELVHCVAFAYIGLRELDKAISLLQETDDQIINVVDAFNLGIAIWCRDGISRKDLFTRVTTDVGIIQSADVSANVAQCLTVAFHLLGDVTNATRWFEEARRLGSSLRRREVSCWRYLSVLREEFCADLDAIEELLSGKPMVPRFMLNDAGLPLM